MPCRRASGGNIVEQQGEEIFVERDGGLAAVTVRDDGALFQAAVALARVPVALGEQVEVVGFLRRVFDAHGELGLWPESAKAKVVSARDARSAQTSVRRDFRFIQISSFCVWGVPSSNHIDAKDNKKFTLYKFYHKYCAAGKSSGGALYFFHILLQWGERKKRIGGNGV